VSLDPGLLAKVPQTEDALALVRKILLGHLLSPSRAVDMAGEDFVGVVHELARLWPLGRWNQCRDPALIGEAFSWLIRCCRGLAMLPGLGDLAGHQPPDHWKSERTAGPALDGAMLVGSGSRRQAEELLLTMMTDLEIWRLPSSQLLTPWVPSQVLTAHVTAQCKELEDRQLALVDDARENLEEIARLNAVVAQLTSRLDATDARSNQCMQKQADLNNIIRQLK